MTLLYRIPIMGLFVDQYLAWNVGAKLVYESTNYCAWFQVCAHTTIAVNRFTAFFVMDSYDRIWSGKAMAGILAVLFLSPVPGLVTCFTAAAHYALLPNGKFVSVYDDSNVDQVDLNGLCFDF